MTNSLFLQVDGVKGDSQDVNHQGWIHINSYSWGTAQTVSVDGNELRIEKVNHHELQIDAKVDSSMATMLHLCSSGRPISAIMISACKASKAAMEYNTVQLKDVLITGINLSRTHSGEQNVTYSFKGEKIEHRYWSQQKENCKIPQNQMDRDIADVAAVA